MKDSNNGSADIISLEAAKERPNYYEILQIAPEANHAEITKAFRRAKEAYRQNSLTAYSLFSEDEMANALNLIDDAYHVLGFPEKRRIYDLAYFPAKENQSETQNSRPARKKSTAGTRRGSARADKAFEKLVSQTSEFNGAALKAIREHKNLALEEIADQTKISRSCLKAIEGEQSEVFPPRVYLMSFLRQYAVNLGLDPQKVVDTYPPLQEEK